MNDLANKEAFKLGTWIGRAYVNPNIFWTGVAAAGAGLLSILYASKKYKKIQKDKEIKKNWEEERIKVVEERNSKIEKFLKSYQSKISEERIKYIISLDATELAAAIKQKSISAVEAFLTYAIRSATIGKDMCYIADVDFENALHQAEIIDNQIKNNKTTNLPLLAGVPISIKDQINVKGVKCTVGYTSRANVIPDKDSELVNVLRKHGAIPFVVSNVPHGVFTIETISKLWGAAQNPWNRMKTTGGSSGGEAGLVATGCSPLGLGSDIAGSIRVPANYCGLYGFKPTVSRISKLGTFSHFPSSVIMQTSYGPISKTAEDCVLLSKALLGNFDDVNVNNKPFDEETFEKFKNISKDETKSIRLGYLYDIDFVETANGVKESIVEVVENLTKQGYDLIPFKFPDELVKLGFKIAFNSEGIEDIIETLKGEEPESYYKDAIHLRSLSNSEISAMQKQAKLLGEERKAEYMELTKKIDRSEFIDTIRKFFEEKIDFLKYIEDNKLQGLITPVVPFPATNLYTGNEAFKFVHYTFLFNLVDMPAGHVPLKLNKNVEYTTKYKDELAKFIKESVKNSEGIPLGVQIATLPNQDEKCLAFMNIIDNIHRFDKNYHNKVFEKLGQTSVI